MKYLIKVILFLRFSFLPFLRHPLFLRLYCFPLYRFFKLNIIFLISAKPIKFLWLDKVKVILTPSEHGMSGNYYFRLHEFYNMIFSYHYLRPDDVFVDVGANVGSYSLLLAALKQVRCFAYEPIPETFNKLINNINLNRLEYLIKAEAICISDNNEKVYLSMSSDSNCANSVINQYSSSSSINVPCSSLDKKLNKIDSISLIKLDVEGHEIQALKGAINIMNDSPPRCLLVEDKSAQVTNFLVQQNYVAFSYNPFKRLLCPLDKYNSVDNTLWIHRKSIDYVSDRVNSSQCLKIDNLSI